MKTRIFTYIGPIRGQKGTRNMAYGAHILQTSKISSSELTKSEPCESSGKLLQNGRKFEILTSFWPFSGKKRPKICPTPVQGLKFKYTWKYLWYACEPSFMFTH